MLCCLVKMVGKIYEFILVDIVIEGLIDDEQGEGV